ncbi:Cullin-4 [Tetrabaena socialis]|uniref:Cullin-4 n=1 Tax=Tetrabaena socialis TaxID=47790 RepID=A0A2J8A8Q6_9CHLO|nr:Cullin-4 [Tetrabaena socialis]|eukprot:PNH08922.1 Cullin-4 [Tetrabaena socialis]
MSAVLGARGERGKAPTGGLLPVNGGPQQTKKLVIKPLKGTQECDSHVAAHVASLADCLSLEAVPFLDRMDAVWQDHCSQMLMIRQIFLYLDRTHVLQLSSSSTPVKSIFDMGLALFRAHLAARPEIKLRTVEGLLELVERERCGEAVNRVLVKGLLRMLSSLGIYADAFHEPFMRASSQFYRAEGERLMAELDIPAYLRHCETRLSEEFERCSEYLDPSSRRPLIAAVEAQLVGRHTGPLLDRGLGPLLDGHRVADLGRLYGLLARVGASEALRAAFREHVRATGLALVKDEEKDKEMVERLLDLKARLDEVVASAFGRAEPFAASLKDSFEHFINQRANKPAELIAKFVDARLRAGGRAAGVTALDRASAVFREFYLSKYSGRRLVWQHSLGSCVLRANFPKGLKELSVSSFQAAVLMLFNDADTLSYADIASACGLEEKELKRTLQSLACGKVRVLTKEPKGREVADSDSFSFYSGFSEKLFRIKINSIQMKETEEENKKTNEQVLQDRQYQIDAALVRIMKTRKTLSHKLLVAESLLQLKFPLKGADLKKRIESLIDREYLARDSTDANVYNYLA